MVGPGAAQVHDAGQRVHRPVHDQAGHPGHVREDHGRCELHDGRQADGVVPVADRRPGSRRGRLQGDGRLAAGHHCLSGVLGTATEGTGLRALRRGNASGAHQVGGSGPRTRVHHRSVLEDETCVCVCSSGAPGTN